MATTTTHKLSINEEEQAVDQDTETSSEGVPLLREGENEHGQDAHRDRDEEDEEKSEADEGTAELSEIILGEHGVGRKSNSEHGCHERSCCDNSWIVSGADEADNEGHAQGENGEDGVVCGALSRNIFAT